MIGALFYLQAQTFRNRMWMRLQRLRKPKYLAGAIVGFLYFYLYFFRYMFHAGRTRNAAFNPLPSMGDTAILETLGALALLTIVLLAWIIPHGRAALVFSEAETAFLFPAPVSRRTLVHFKLIKSQTAILFTTLFLTLVFGRFGRGHSAWIHAAGWWLILSTLNLHFLGSSFARTLLLDRGISNWKRRVGVVLVVTLAFGAIYYWSQNSMRAPTPEDTKGIKELGAYFQEIFATGPALYLLGPFRAMVRPFLAPSFPAFLQALWPAALLLVFHYVWVIRSNVAFEESSLALSRRMSERVSEFRKGNYQPASKKASKPPFQLHPVGPLPIAILWKNLIAAGKMFSVRTVFILCMIMVPMGVVITQGNHGSGMGPVFGMLAAGMTIWSVFLGPQILRQDFRHDLPNVDMLKLMPVRGWQIVLGELLAPALILAVLQWSLLLLAAVLMQDFPPNHPLSIIEKAAIVFGAAVLMPFLNLISLLIPNAAVLLFPGWFQVGKDAPHGIEAMGQRIIFVLGQMVVFVLGLVPAAIGFSIGFFPLMLATNVFAAIPVGACGAAIALAVESAIALLLLGKWFENFDISSEPQG